nr:(R)-specific enoyl-CoA hydratase [Ipomoea batatas]
MPNPSHSIRTASYSNEEDKLLCSIFMDIAQDARKGSDRSVPELWEHIAQEYKQRLPAHISTNRPWRSLQTRWANISIAVSKLRGCIQQIEKMNPSGASEQDILYSANGCLVYWAVSGYYFSSFCNVGKLYSANGCLVYGAVSGYYFLVSAMSLYSANGCLVYWAVSGYYFSSFCNVATNLLKCGDVVKQARVFTEADVVEYSKLSHDTNPLHFDSECATLAGFSDRLVPGMLVASLFPRTIASNFPGAVYVSQTLHFKLPVYIGEEIVGELCATNIKDLKTKHVAKFSTKCFKRDGGLVIDGEATAILIYHLSLQACP